MARKPAPKKPRFFRYFDTTIPVLKTCRLCGVWLAAAISEGQHVQADLTALDIVQQQLVILGGGRLFSFTRMSLVHLDAYRLTDPKFGVRYPGHRCGVKWEARLGTPVPQGLSDDQIPF